MEDILLILHFIAFSLGIGGGVANVYAGLQMRATEGPARAGIGAIQRRIGMTSAGALIVLWITGLLLVYVAREGWSDLPALFWAKFAVVLVLTALSVRLQLLSIGAMRSGTPPPGPVMARLGQAALGAAVLAVILAVAAF